MCGARASYGMYYDRIEWEKTTGMHHLLWTLRFLYGAKNMPALMVKDGRIIQCFRETIARHIAEAKQRNETGNSKG